MIQIILRSMAIALFISFASLFCTDYYLQPDPEFEKYCETIAYDDVECTDLIEPENDELKKIILFADILYLSTEFIVAFLGALVLGIWLYFYPVKGLKDEN